jgi:hypothetical protein
VGGAWIRRFDGKMIQTPETLQKRADSHLSAARCVGHVFEDSIAFQIFVLHLQGGN